MCVADLSSLLQCSRFLIMFKIRKFAVKRAADDGNSLFQSLAVLLVNAFFLMLRYLIAAAETVLCCAEYNH